MHHPGDPSLFLCHLFPVRVIYASPLLLRDRLRAKEHSSTVRLVTYEDMAELKDAVDIFRSLDYGFVFEDGRNKPVSQRSPSLECLDGQERGILLERKESEHRLIGIDRRGKQRRKIGYSLRRMQIRAKRLSVRKIIMSEVMLTCRHIP